MKSVLRWGCAVAALALLPVSDVRAQNIHLADGSDLIWRGTTANENAGRWLDLGPVSPGDNRRDLIIGAPGAASVGGRVYVIFGGPVPSGDRSLSSANVVITGPGAGDGFGTSTAVGPVLVHSSNLTSNLVVGAPGALGGRGAVYVFDTPLNSGALTHSHAAFVVHGAEGDQLGTTLATADINNDGYREIVIGAPGKNRVYVISGASTLAGTRDLSLTGGDLLINGAGIGGSLHAGDITGDGIYEIIIGSPTANAVYLLTGGYPDVSNLPADADAVFSGIDVGDAAGAGMRTADFDGDGQRDLFIGAPGGDGPANGRTNAGEAYLFWGRPTFTSMSLASADVTFYGANPHYALGYGISAGDINRDTPNDVVFRVEGGTAGELIVYYGRARTAIGVDAGGGRRVVDFATPDTASRHIFGNPASGPIVTSAVYELTGEGARDIVVGVPGDSSSAGGAFFAISPKMQMNPESITLSLVEGTETNRAMVLENASTIPISWTAGTNRSWLQPWPTSGTSSAGNYASLTLYIYTAGLPHGTHTGAVTFTSTSEHLEMFRTVNVTLTVTPAPCTYQLSTTSVAAGYTASTRTITVTTPAHCAWSGVSNAGFVTIPDGSGRTGTGTITLNFAANASASSRNGTATIASQTVTLNQAGVPTAEIIRARELARTDFNADGKSDLLLQNTSNGNLSVWQMDGHSVTATLPLSHGVLDNNWRIAGTGDFNFDGKPDIVWHHQTEGWVFLWYMNGTSRIGFTYFSRDRVNIGWRIAGVGDFNNDGKPDLIWQNDAEGRIAFWFCDGVTVLGFEEMPIQFVDKRWRIAGAGDFNGDGDTDLLLRHIGYGEIGVWTMSGAMRTGYITLNPGAIIDQNWQAAAIIDANADNKPDIIWHHQGHGGLAIWYMDGTSRTANPSFTTALPANTRVGGPK